MNANIMQHLNFNVSVKILAERDVLFLTGLKRLTLTSDQCSYLPSYLTSKVESEIKGAGSARHPEPSERRAALATPAFLAAASMGREDFPTVAEFIHGQTVAHTAALLTSSSDDTRCIRILREPG